MKKLILALALVTPMLAFASVTGTTGDQDCDNTLLKVVQASSQGNVNDIAILSSQPQTVRINNGSETSYEVTFSEAGDTSSKSTAQLVDPNGGGCQLLALTRTY